MEKMFGSFIIITWQPMHINLNFHHDINKKQAAYDERPV